MFQPDLFDNNDTHYFLTQLEKLDTSYSKRFRAIFALMTETQNEFLTLKDLVLKLVNEKNGNENAAVR